MTICKYYIKIKKVIITLFGHKLFNYCVSYKIYFLDYPGLIIYRDRFVYRYTIGVQCFWTKSDVVYHCILNHSNVIGSY